MSNVPVRKPNRLKNYDYSSAGAYLVTVCTDGHNQLFGMIASRGGRPEVAPTSLMQLSPLGKIVEAEIWQLSNTYDGVYVDCYVIMPNHVHMIIVIRNGGGRPKVAPTISRMMQQWKGAVTKKAKTTVWQKSFHERIIRNTDEYQRFVHNIHNNPSYWEKDRYFVGYKRPYAAPEASAPRRGELRSPDVQQDI
ncbi:MAG: hypothetical protein LBE55_02165 [Clostridiales bacterium]|jgi:REP element-mobilizing transposase RayT|nr:hypothetical protein [Clostridiales bacterium]